MTRDDIRKKLIYNQNQIGNIRTTINEQESQIENLEGLRNSFNRLLYDFNYKHNMQNARISDINNMSYINSKIVSSYTSAMHGVVNGSEYRKACNEIYRSIDKVNSQIRGTFMSNLKFDENYINEVVKFNSECAAELEDIFTEYQKILDEVIRSAIKEGKTANSLKLYKSCTRKMNGQIDSLT